MASTSPQDDSEKRLGGKRAEVQLAPFAARPKLADEVAHRIRHAILTGAYKTGDKLVLEQLADQLGVSIMPVREALISLQSQALVTAVPRKGFRVHPLNQQDLDDLFELHAHLAGILAGRAALVVTPADVAQLRSIQERLVAASSPPISRAASRRLAECNGEFHRYINRLPSGDRIRWFIRQTVQFIPDDLYRTVPGWLEGSLRDHPKIIDALDARDRSRARSLMESHLFQGAELIGRSLKHPVFSGRMDGMDGSAT